MYILVPWRSTYLETSKVRLAVRAGGSCWDSFLLPFRSIFSPSLWEEDRYGLKYFSRS